MFMQNGHEYGRQLFGSAFQEDLLQKDTLDDLFPEIRDVVKSCLRMHSYAETSILSYEYFMEYMMEHIILENRTLTVTNKNDGEVHTFEFGDRVTVGSPNHKETDGDIHMVRPQECRVRGLCYCAPVFLDITHLVHSLPSEEETKQEEGCRGQLKQRTVYREIPLFRIPVMVKSKFCNVSREGPWKYDECEYDHGGYFVVRGNEKVIQNQETLRTNYPFLFRLNVTRYGYTVEVRSRFEGKFRSTSTLNVKITSKKGGTMPQIFVTLPFLTVDIPLMVLFRLMQFHQPGDIEACFYSDAARHEPTHPEHAEVKLLQHMLDHDCKLLDLDHLYEQVGVAGTKEPTREKRRKYIQHLITNEFLPHLGYSDDPLTKRKKLLYMGLIVRKLLKVHLCESAKQVQQLCNDRDHMGNKRIATAGILIALLFRQLFLRFRKTLRMQLLKVIEQQGSKRINLVDCINFRKITSGLRTAFAVGNWNVNRQSGTHQGVTQLLNRMSIMAKRSHIMRVNTPVCREGKCTKMRQLHSSHWGVMCASETPEGPSCGLIKTLTTMAYIRMGVPTSHVRRALYDHFHHQPLRPWGVNALTEEALPDVDASLVLVNGDIVGTTTDLDRLCSNLRKGRRDRRLPWDLSVTVVENNVLLHSDSGCLMRPLFVTDNIHKLHDICVRLKQGRLTNEIWQVLVDEGVIEYVDKEEEDFMVVAVRPSDLTHARYAYTHLEIHGIAILGLAASLIPFSNYNQAPRNIYQAAMGKQAVTQSGCTYMKRVDTASHVPHYSQKPLVHTWMDDITQTNEMPMGMNAVVAIMCYGGYTQEDAVIVNRGAIDRGLFRSSYYNCYKDEERAGGADHERFENPLTSDVRCMGMRNANYEKLDESGTVAVNSIVESGDVLIGKTMNLTDADAASANSGSAHDEGAQVKRDKSTIYHGNAPAIVDRVIGSVNREGMRSWKVILRQQRIPQEGDKLSSRHGQKGTIGMIMNPEDMPQTMSGIIPDIIMNPHAFPSRMTIAQLRECLLGKLGCTLGKFGDGTPFKKVSMQSLQEGMKAAGYDPCGEERMINGMTGEMMEASIFIGPVYYQRLKHMVEDKVHARTRGPIQVMTRQPVEGRSRQGGLRIGEMERDCFIAHGSAELIRDKLFLSSDYFEVPICTLCGNFADNAHNQDFMNEGSAVVKPFCRLCQSHEVKIVSMPYAYKLLAQELQAINIKIKHVVE